MSASASIGFICNQSTMQLDTDALMLSLIFDSRSTIIDSSIVSGTTKPTKPTVVSGSGSGNLLFIHLSRTWVTFSGCVLGDPRERGRFTDTVVPTSCSERTSIVPFNVVVRDLTMDKPKPQPVERWSSWLNGVN